MKQITLGQTTEKVSQIALGCMGMGGSWDKSPLTDDIKKNAILTVATALENGINFFDHADIYTYGKSEEAFASIWESNLVQREDIFIQSKCGIRLKGDLSEHSAPHYDFSYEHIMNSVDGILNRLKVEYLDSLLLHRPDALVEPEEVAKAFNELHQSGKVKYFGVSNHNPYQIELLKKYIDQPLMINQMELSLAQSNLIDEGMNVNSLTNPIEHRSHGTLEYARLNGMTIQAWSPIAAGKLTGDGVEASHRPLTQLLANLSSEYAVSQEAIMIAWLLRHPAKIQPVVGTKNPARIDSICKANQITLTREQWYQLYNAMPGRGLL